MLGLAAGVLLIPASVYGQAMQKVSGTVRDLTGEPLIGASVKVKGQKNAVVTDIDGNFTISVPAGAAQLEFSYVGYDARKMDIGKGRMEVVLSPNTSSLDEVVVIGYGTRKKDDLTGSIATVTEKDFNKGVISSPEQLVNGKIAGVQIVNGGGSVNGGSTIRVRGGASLNASNDPLIVVDGVPMEIGGGITGSGNFLGMINPNDIESMTVLKDAASTAIYGSRASNGVIIITTKKGSGKIKVDFQSTNSLAQSTGHVSMLSRDQLIQEVNATGNTALISALGTENTDWNKEIFRTAFSTDNNLSVAGRVTDWLPIRVAVGVSDNNGILRGDEATRYSGNVNITPSFFGDLLRVNVSGKGSYARNRFVNSGAIWNAAAYDPTQPVYSKDPAALGGFHEVVDKNGVPGQGAIANPVGMLLNPDNTAEVWRGMGNVDVDYRLHCFRDLRLHATGGMDYAQGKSHYVMPQNSFEGYKDGGFKNDQGPQTNENRLLTLYAAYAHKFDSLLSDIDLTAGYDYQWWRRSAPAYDSFNEAGELRSTTPAWDERHALVSFYARLNYTLADRYLLTATVRRDGSSRFSPENRWGSFPSVALAWRMTKEPWFEPLTPYMNEFKVRVSYGVTGQQDGIANYSYLPKYTVSQNGASYWFNGQWTPTYRPEAYNSDLKWETTRSWNYGVDFGLLNNRMSGSVECYTRKTENLLATVPVPAGVNFAKEMLTNVGNVSSKGVEMSLSWNFIDSKDWSWTLTGNATWQENKITNLSLGGGDAADTYVGYAESTPVMVYKTGYAPHTFLLYKQIYAADGTPIEGLYADLNGDGIVNEHDRYYVHNAHPDWMFGLSSSLRYKRLTLSTSLRANVGNYLYNQMSAGLGASECFSWCAGQVNNLSASYADTHFSKRRYESDYYLENASFLKMDNLQLTYDFGKLGFIQGLNLSAMVQNVFTITKYSGLDPENDWGIEGSVYPRPRTYSLTVGLNF